ncbi:MAG: KH domain-containing protein [Acidimicrobiales bacterium]|jgi:predicted RNA-binding protein YlqC (UPF0109 family)
MSEDLDQGNLIEPAMSEEDERRSEQIESLVTFLGQSLLPSTDGMSIRRSLRGDSLRLTVQVPSNDLGKVIGKGGRIANSIRTVVGVLGAKIGLETSIEFTDGRRPSGGRGGGRGRGQGSRPRRRD